MPRKRIIKPEPGKLLLSEPFLTGSYFKRAVVLIGKNDEEGTVGFILNKPTGVPINDAVDAFPDFEGNLYFGGPIATDSLFYIHTVNGLLKGSREITNGVYWGGDYEQLKFLIDTKQIKPNQIRFFCWIFWVGGQTAQCGNQGEILACGGAYATAHFFPKRKRALGGNTQKHGYRLCHSGEFPNRSFAKLIQNLQTLRYLSGLFSCTERAEGVKVSVC